MEREIKFKRAHFFDEGKIKFSHFSEWGKDIKNAVFTSPSFNSSALYFTDLQYTGLKDKNGKEIYEGDVVSILDKTSREYPYIGEVKWNEFVTGFEAYPKELHHSLFLHNPNPEERLIKELKQFMRSPRTIEVLGNIYENPELLTQLSNKQEDKQ